MNQANGVEIPASAWTAAAGVASVEVVRDVNGSPSRITTLIEDTVRATASLIVAAELERLVDETDWAWAVGSSLRARAAELRGEA